LFLESKIQLPNTVYYISYSVFCSLTYTTLFYSLKQICSFLYRL